jgi:hypothetical protein
MTKIPVTPPPFDVSKHDNPGRSAIAESALPAARAALGQAGTVSDGHRTVLGQDVSYRRDPTEQTYTYLIYVQRDAAEIRITSNDGWYGVKTVLCDDEQIAITLFEQIIANPKAMFREIYEDDCAWFEPFDLAGRTADGSDSVRASDARVHVSLTPRNDPTGPDA